MKLNYILKEMRQTKAGDHMVLLYDDKDYIGNADVIAAYIISRVTNNEKCFYISGDIDTELIKEIINSSIEIQKYIDNGQLTILNKEDSYSRNGKFDSRKMIDLLKKLSSEAIEEGYDAFSITGEISWVLEYEDGFKKIMDYEYMLNEEIFGNYPVSAVCRYNVNKFSSKMIKNIIEVHPLIIWKGSIHENPFYVELVNSLDIDIETYQVKSMLETIEDFTYTKSRFHDKIRSEEKKYQELQLNQLKNMIVTLTGLLEIHDEYTKDHSEKVANISKKVAEELGLSKEEVTHIYYAGLVHDIGKAILSKDIINKKGKLNLDEYKMIQKHPLHGYKALMKTKELNNIAVIVLQHHERIDGEGYPLGLKGKDINVGARIICIADAFDAMTSDRPYRRALTKEEAVQEIKNNMGRQFDKEIADVFINKVLFSNNYIL